VVLAQKVVFIFPLRPSKQILIYKEL